MEKLSKLIEMENGAYVYKSKEKIYTDYGNQRTESKYLLIVLRKLGYENLISITDSINQTEYIIEFKTEKLEVPQFDFKGNEEIILSLINHIDYIYCLQLLDVNSFLEFFKIKGRSIYKHLLLRHNNDWEIIDYCGLIIRHLRYYNRYSDFGTDAYKISIIGNPKYFSPFIKRPFEFDYFDSEKTEFYGVYPKELFEDIHHYSGVDLVEIILKRAFNYFFDGREFVAINYDNNKYVKESDYHFDLSYKFRDRIHILNMDKLKFYILDVPFSATI